MPDSTVKHDKPDKSSRSLAQRMMLSSAVSVLIAILMMTLLFTFFLNKRFGEYIALENRETRNELVRNLSDYMMENATLDREWMERFSNMYMEQGIFISLNSPEGDVMWSCMEDNAMVCSMHMDGDDPDFFDNLETASYELPRGTSNPPLSLNVSYNPSDKYSENDRFFLLESIKMLFLSMVLSLIVSALASFGLSRSMSRPLKDLSDYALRLAGHDYRARDSFQKGTREIDALHSAIDQLAGALESQEELRRRLTNDVSHELRTPLTKIQSTLEAMIDGIWPRDEERLQGCHREILRLTGLVSQLDDLNRYDSDTGALIKHTVSLRESLLYVMKIFEQDCRDRNISLTLRIKEVRIQGDEEKLKQVWINLISNALKFTDDNGEITVSMMMTGDQAVISIADTGLGIDSRDLPNIFERFYKADISRNKNGSGLGLSIVREIIDLHDGSISVESRKGEGSVFRVHLPLNQ